MLDHIKRFANISRQRALKLDAAEAILPPSRAPRS